MKLEMFKSCIILILILLSAASNPKEWHIFMDRTPKENESSKSMANIFDNSHHLSHILAYDNNSVDTYLANPGVIRSERKIIKEVTDIRSKPTETDRTEYGGRVLVGKGIKEPYALVIIFRGTNSICNLAEDLRITQVKMTNKNFKSFKDAKVHEGFMNVYKSLRNELRKTVLKMLSEDKNLKSILVTGHSLGGALANLCVVDMSFYYNEGEGKTIAPNGLDFNLVTFGAPRVGDKTFANYVNSIPKLKRNIRVIEKDDLITQIPVTLDFEHAGTSVTFDEKFIFGETNIDDTPRLELAKDLIDPEGTSTYATEIIKQVNCKTTFWDALNLIHKGIMKARELMNDKTFVIISIFKIFKNLTVIRPTTELILKLTEMGKQHTTYKERMSPMKYVRLFYPSEVLNNKKFLRKGLGSKNSKKK